ncbi:Nucleotidyltransferase [Thermodesulfovibrio sp. N1]|uniref:type VII toxin-antitoxin system MntA family adenylyltransferase antitoxin n=1 Tax=unclassified Thermodesulfovibrio TaxID=2645936 RepID=UPI000839FEFE|nr:MULTISPECIES: nucleotidyltransferase domain-containing protein [unclassified Thermodesulfovibrio]MDI1472588.1 nucleotidyltransferase domain-containing protein [Thermodesulfovibrio sp. 1176]ODA44407.1 Nucleotidyltransferase [Thermodesulfovibrio sp. N1]
MKISLDGEKLQSLGVSAILIFGSTVEGTMHPNSDIDFAVLFKDKSHLKSSPVQVYGEIYEELTKNFKGNIDIVYLHETPLSLQFNAVNDGELIFCADEEFFYEYKDRVIMLYLDFKYFEGIFDRALIKND